jgi:xanthine dehydrogenase accessory factor
LTHADLLERASDLRSSRTPFVLATVVRAVRPASAKPGDRALVLPDGTMEGFVGGACSESTVRAQGLRQLASGRSTLLRITPLGGPAADSPASPESGLPESGQPQGEGLVLVGNPCLSGGTLDIFLEVMRPPMLVHVYGDTPVARALSAVGQAAGWDMQQCADAGAEIPPDAGAVVVASQGGDEPRVLAAALRAGVPYVGLLASRRRGAAVLAALDLPAGQRERLHTPAGLDIGARTPGEVAISIVAEIVERLKPGRASQGTEQAQVIDTAPLSDGTAPAEAPAAGLAEAGLVEALDPVCGMTVAVVPASLQLQHAGTTLYFCGPGCRDAFAANPGRYAS